MALRIYLISAIVITTYACHHREFGIEKRKDALDTEIKRGIQFYRDNNLIVGFNVEIARTAEERTRGLMFRNSLPEDKGMLFIFEDETDHHFWMKNTYIPLDLIFINSDLKVVGTYENATPMSEEPIHIGRPSKYVLEINGGLSKRFNIDPDTRVVFINIFF